MRQPIVSYYPHMKPSDMTLAAWVEDTTAAFKTDKGFSDRINAMRFTCHYIDGELPPNYPVPATTLDAEYDLEYVWMLQERARLIKELRDVRGDSIN